MTIIDFWGICNMTAVTVNHSFHELLVISVTFLTKYCEYCDICHIRDRRFCLFFGAKGGGRPRRSAGPPGRVDERKAVKDKVEQSLSQQLAELRIDDIDLEKVVYDPEYRRAVIRRLSAAKRRCTPDPR